MQAGRRGEMKRLRSYGAQTGDPRGFHRKKRKGEAHDLTRFAFVDGLLPQIGPGRAQAPADSPRRENTNFS